METYRNRFTHITKKRQKRYNLIEKSELLEKQKVMIALEIESEQKMLLEEKNGLSRLESATWSSTINSILNSKIEKIEQERAKLYTDQLKFEQLKDNYNHVIREYDHLKNQLKQYDGVEHEYQLLLEEIAKGVVNQDTDEAKKLTALLQQSSEFENERISLHEALREGVEVLKKLNDAKSYMNKAKNWGEYDLSGGGIAATVEEYHYLDEAQEILRNVQWGLRKFHNALNQLGLHEDKEISKFLKISDYWIDGIFIELSLQSAIKKLIESINDLIYEVMKIDETLRKEEVNSEKKKEAMELSLDEFFNVINQE